MLDEPARHHAKYFSGIDYGEMALIRISRIGGVHFLMRCMWCANSQRLESNPSARRETKSIYADSEWQISTTINLTEMSQPGLICIRQSV